MEESNNSILFNIPVYRIHCFRNSCMLVVTHRVCSSQKFSKLIGRKNFIFILSLAGRLMFWLQVFMPTY